MQKSLVLVFRNQKLEPNNLLSAVRLFGDTMEQHLTDTLMESHPEIAVLDSREMPPDKEGKIMFAFKKGLKDLPYNFVPWFKLKISALTRNDRLIFGHWAALNGKTNKQNI